jgi:UDP-N-acetylmuramoyl-tripeptide--D-alanyl-D-alanine ligase
MTTAAFDSAFLGRATGGVLKGDPHGRRVVTDSRDPVEGALFVALEGPHFDGHDFVRAAVARGAGGAVVAEAWYARGMGSDLPLCVVPDPLVALQRMARAHRERSGIPVVAVTGSNGKTTTKEFLAAALASLGPVLKTRGNRNNHIGLPLTLLEIEPRHVVAVVEMGMNHAGEIAHLSRLAGPRAAVITNVSEVHLEGVGDRAGVARAKAEIVEGLETEGVLVYPHGDADLEAALRAYGGERIRFGQDPAADLAPRSASTATGGVELVLDDGTRIVSRVPGEHTAANLLAAVAVADRFGVARIAAAEGMSGVEALPGRLRPLAVGGVTLLDDTYNANPASTRAALDVLRTYPARGKRRAVLGDLLELGAAAETLHRALAPHVLFVDGLITVGPLARHIGLAALEAGMDPDNWRHVADSGEAGAVLLPRLEPGDVVLLKGSRGVRLEVARDMVVGALEGEG